MEMEEPRAREMASSIVTGCGSREIGPAKTIGRRDRSAFGWNGWHALNAGESGLYIIKAYPPRNTGETQRFFANARRTTPCVRRNTSKPANSAPERDAPSRALSLPHEKRYCDSLSFLCRRGARNCAPKHRYPLGRRQSPGGLVRGFTLRFAAEKPDSAKDKEDAVCKERLRSTIPSCSLS